MEARTSARTRSVVVVGGGVGGLAAAVRVASAGARVTLCERAAWLGGKLRRVDVDGHLVEAGPTVVTMPWVFRDLFAAAGARLEDHVTLRPLEPACRHFFPDGARLDLFNDRARSRDAIAAFAGEANARGYDAFCDHAARIFSFVRGPFMESAAPTSLLGLLRPSLLASLPAMLRIDARRTLWRALSAFFPDERLRVLFGRYATYNGSSPFHAPATLAVIPHVEQAFGVHLVEGGIARLADALAALARGLGVEVRTGVEVERILVEDGRARGVIAGGERIAADAVVVNAEARHLFERLLEGEPRAAAESRRLAKLPPSLSAWVLLCVARATDLPLAHHNVFFSGDYRREFVELIDERRPPEDPTVYLCALDRAGERAPAPGADERHLLLTNAPALDEKAPPDWTAEGTRCRTRMLEALRRHGLSLDPKAERAVTPADFSRLFPSSRGAIYGASSNSRTAAFERPPNRAEGWKGIYCVGGSAHPGAGLPMVSLSAKIAAQALCDDLGLAPPRPPAATPGGTSTR